MEDFDREVADVVYNSYKKILKINLSKDSFSIVKITKCGEYINNISSLTQLFDTACQDGIIYKCDVEEFRSKVSVPKLIDYFSKNDSNFLIKYRRRIDKIYVWNLLEIAKSTLYSPSNMECILFVKDLDKLYVDEIKKANKLEYLNFVDALTSLYNYNAYTDYCRKWISREIKESIGVIFADLNALKVVNDTYGHEEGNQYIKRFSKIIKNYFREGRCFRISGDEFIVLYEGIKEADFEEKRNKFFSRLAEDKIPMASAGWAFSSCPSFVQDTVKIAEEKMYEHKEQFYKKFPQYKRNVMEESTRREFHAIISCLASSYSGVALIDLRSDTYFYLKKNRNSNAHYKSWSQYLETYSRLFVTQEYKKLLKRVSSVENLKRDLVKNDSVSIDFETLDGKWIHSVYRPIDFLDGEPVKVALFSEVQDEKRSSRLAFYKRQKYDLHILEALEVEYTFILLINNKTKTMKLHKFNGLAREVITMINNKDYPAAIIEFAKTFVIEEDEQLFVDMSDYTKFLKDKPYYSFTYRTKPTLHDRKSNGESEFTYYRSLPDDDIIVLAGRDLQEDIYK